MATNTLTDQNISDTYKGLLHASGVEITSNSVIYDGNGNATSLSLGVSGQGATITGKVTIGSTLTNGLTSNGIVYPAVDGIPGAIMVTNGAGTARFTSTLPISSLQNLSPDPTGTYSNPSSVTVNSSGLVTSITSGTGTDPFVEYIYTSPIVLHLTEQSNTESGTVTITDTLNVNQINKPTGVTYAIIQVFQSSDSTNNNNRTFGMVALNDIVVSATGASGSTSIAGNVDTAPQSNITRVPALINAGTVSLSASFRNTSTRFLQIQLIGYNNAITLSNF